MHMHNIERILCLCVAVAVAVYFLPIKIESEAIRVERMPNAKTIAITLAIFSTRFILNKFVFDECER